MLYHAVVLVELECEPSQLDNVIMADIEGAFADSDDVEFKEVKVIADELKCLPVWAQIAFKESK